MLETQDWTLGLPDPRAIPSMGEKSCIEVRPPEVDSPPPKVFTKKQPLSLICILPEKLVCLDRPHSLANGGVEHRGKSRAYTGLTYYQVTCAQPGTKLTNKK